MVSYTIYIKIYIYILAPLRRLTRYCPHGAYLRISLSKALPSNNFAASVLMLTLMQQTPINRWPPWDWGPFDWSSKGLERFPADCDFPDNPQVFKCREQTILQALTIPCHLQQQQNYHSSPVVLPTLTTKDTKSPFTVVNLGGQSQPKNANRAQLGTVIGTTAECTLRENNILPPFRVLYGPVQGPQATLPRCQSLLNRSLTPKQ